MTLDAGMVLAAGKGTRMRPLTDHTPKPLLPVAGRTLLDRALDRLVEVGISRAVVNLHHLPEQMIAHCAARAAEPPEIRLSDETGALLETGGGVRAALPLLGGPAFLTINGDNIWTAPRALAPLRAAWDPERMDALLLLIPVARTVGYTRAGDFSLTEDGRLIRRGEAPIAPYVYTGAQVLTARSFEEAPDGAFSLNLIWDRLIRAGRAYGCLAEGDWVDVGTPEGLRLAEDLVSNGVN